MMNLKKPKFWDYKKANIYAYLLYPLSLFIKSAKFFSITKPRSFKLKTICVGNIYLGGTGKTSLSIKIKKILEKKKIKSCFIKKLYSNQTDEQKLLKNNGKVFLSSNRIEALKQAEQENYNVAILDDGLQDKSINIDFKILCFNAKQWIGNGQVIPSGPLREPVKSVIDYDCIIINGKKDVIKEKVLTKYNPLLNIFYSSYELIEKDFFVGKKIVAFAGIGNPKNFFDLILENNLNLIKSFSYPDHYEFKEKEMNKMLEFSENNNSILITTEKDYFRLNNIYCNKVKAAKVKLNIENHKEFEKLLLNKIK